MKPFVVLAQPRSRTAWLSHFLTYGPWHCGHETARHWRSLEDVKAWLSMPNTGTAETAVAPYWRTMLKLCPDINIVVIRRDIEDSVRSFEKLPGGWHLDLLRQSIAGIDRKLDQIVARVPGVLEVNFNDLTQEAVCAQIFERCLGVPHDSARWKRLAAMNIQCDMKHLVNYTNAYMPLMRGFAAKVKQDTLLDFDRAQRFFEGEELTIKEETDYDSWLARSTKAFEKHCYVAGFETNHILADHDHDAVREGMANGTVQIISASSNGEIHGYLMTTIERSVAVKGQRIADHGMFYAAPTHPGLGRKLIKAANAALRHHGVERIRYRAGINGDGPRLDKLYQRMGAERIGEMFLQTL